MWYDGLFNQMAAAGDKEQATKMSAYMQNRFSFYGIAKPQLKEIYKPYLKEAKKLEFDYDFVSLCWSNDYREAQYVAIEYIMQNLKKLSPADLPFIKGLITEKSWWETVDSLDAVVGALVLKDPELKKEMLNWSVSQNLWLRRVAIDFQQEYKEETDWELLKTIIENNMADREFFITKAIGWSLRDYSKIYPDRVREFIDQNREKLSTLSVREASKYCVHETAD